MSNRNKKRKYRQNNPEPGISIADLADFMKGAIIKGNEHDLSAQLENFISSIWDPHMPEPLNESIMTHLDGAVDEK